MQARGIRLITALIATLGLCAEAHASSVSGGYLIGVGFSFSSSPVFQIDPSTGAGMEQLVREQLPELPEDHLIVEPALRNTGPAVALECALLEAQWPGCTIASLGSDHYIGKPEEFNRLLQAAAVAVDEHPETLFTVGVKPTRAETGYGYIGKGEVLCQIGADVVYQVTEFTEKPICRASRLFQKLKIEQLQKQNLPEGNFKYQYDRITEKACLCNDLGEGVLIKNEVPKNGFRFAAICPGPNMAYFSKITSLTEIMGHIYGRNSILNGQYRPNMFIKELKCYIDYLIDEVKKCPATPTERQIKYFNEFRTKVA